MTWIEWRREMSLFAGIGLVVFEITEVIWLGFQPLLAIFGMLFGICPEGVGILGG